MAPGGGAAFAGTGRKQNLSPSSGSTVTCMVTMEEGTGMAEGAPLEASSASERPEGADFRRLAAALS
jgi:hypothetical protein